MNISKCIITCIIICTLQNVIYVYILHKLKQLDNLQSSLPEATRDMAREGAFLVDGSDGNFFLPYRWVHENFRGSN